jgi:MFS family permease
LRLVSDKAFWLLVALMACAGAAEQSMGQWASFYAESGLGVSKAVGDIAGPCLFAAAMGLSRTLYAKIGASVGLERYMLWSAFACVLGYLLLALSPFAGASFSGCALVGFSVGIFWPGALSLSAARYGPGAAAMFAGLVLAGSAGGAAGPAIVGLAAASSGSIKTALLAGAVFPAAFALALKARAKAPGEAKADPA